jgi:DeoR/GlpR family transcriptional regulator of sugar metabolism
LSNLNRLGTIVEIAMKKGSISVPEICEHFGVSDMTARRYLNELDRQGLLRRVHGGAIPNLARSYEPPFPTRATKNSAAKTAIGLKAAELVFDGDSIALDVGTTTLEMVAGLRGKHNITILTACLQIANRVISELSLSTDVRLILTGGVVRAQELSMIGSIPQSVFKTLHVDKAFIGTGGIHLEEGLTEYNMEDALTKQVLIASAREKIVVADGSKFGVTTFASVASLSQVDKIVTDCSAPPEMIEQIRAQGVEIILADAPGRKS